MIGAHQESVSGDESWLRRHGFAVRVGVTVLFVWMASTRIDWADVWDSLRRSSGFFFLLSLLLAFTVEGIIAYRLSVLMRRTVIHADWSALWRLGFIAKFYGFFLPAGVGPALIKWYKVTKGRHGRLAFAGITFFEQTLNALQTLLFVAVPVMFSKDPRISHLRPELLLASLMVFSVLAVVYLGFFFESSRKLLVHWSELALEKLNLRRSLVAAWVKELHCVAKSRDGLSLVIVTSLALQATIVFRLILLFLAVGLVLPWQTILWAGSLVVFLQSLPITLSGIGLRESALAYTAVLYGMEPELGVAVGLLLLSQIALLAAIGGVFEWLDTRSKDGD